MAMSQVQPLLLLLGSFFFLPTFLARGLDFEYCNGNSTGYDFGSIIRVENSRIIIGPDEVKTVSFTVDGYASITRNHTNWRRVEVLLKFESSDYILNYYDPCKLIACPVKPGTHFRLSLSDVVYYSTTKKFSIRLFAYEGDQYDERETIFCVTFDMPRSPTSVSA